MISSNIFHNAGNTETDLQLVICFLFPLLNIGVAITATLQFSGKVPDSRHLFTISVRQSLIKGAKFFRVVLVDIETYPGLKLFFKFYMVFLISAILVGCRLQKPTWEMVPIVFACPNTSVLYFCLISSANVGPILVKNVLNASTMSWELDRIF